jgi:hypothetical protein
MRRRDFIALVGSSVAGWPLAARAQQAAIPVIGYLDGGSLGTSAHVVAAIRKGLSETGHVEGSNVTIEYHWAEGKAATDRLAPTRCAIQPAARQRPRSDAEISGGEVSL